jgi:hypothetical protein
MLNVTSSLVTFFQQPWVGVGVVGVLQAWAVVIFDTDQNKIFTSDAVAYFKPLNFLLE